MQIGLSKIFQKKINQTKIQFKLQQYSAATQTQRKINVEQEKLEGDLLDLSDDRSIIRATYYLHGLLIKSETVPYFKPESSTPQTQQQPTQTQTQTQSPLQHQRSIHSAPLSPQELKERHNERDQRRQKEQTQNKEIFVNSIEKEAERQQIIIKTYTFVHLKDKNIRTSLTPDQESHYKEQFKKFMSEINTSILIYRGISTPKEWPIFELVRLLLSFFPLLSLYSFSFLTFLTPPILSQSFDFSCFD